MGIRRKEDKWVGEKENLDEGRSSNSARGLLFDDQERNKEPEFQPYVTQAVDWRMAARISNSRPQSRFAWVYEPGRPQNVRRRIE